MGMSTEPKRILNLCYDVARIFHAENESYAETSGKMMFMIAAHESKGFRARRQYGFARGSIHGAFGLFQSEWPPMLDNLQWLRVHRGYHDGVFSSLRDYAGVVDAGEDCEESGLLYDMLQAEPRMREAYKRDGVEASHSDPLARRYRELAVTKAGDMFCGIMCRVHLMRQPGKLPSSPLLQSVYAKDYYNTSEGSATPALYLKAYSTWMAEALQPDQKVRVSMPNPESPFAQKGVDKDVERPATDT